MDEYESRILDIYSDYDLVVLRDCLELAQMKSYKAYMEFKETGLSHYKETKETQAQKAEILKFVIATREFHDEDKAVEEAKQ
jgi:hypothetical protein